MKVSILVKFLGKFFHEKKSNVYLSILFSMLATLMESIIIPRFLAHTFNILHKNTDLNILKNTLIKLVGLWLSVKIIYMISNNLRKKLEPEITQYIIIELVKAVFKKYEKENEFTNVTILINKINIIKKNLQELFYIICTVFIPRIIVIIFGIYNFYTINVELGNVLSLCIIGQIIWVLKDIRHCVEASYNDIESKDQMFEYIEDIIYNIEMIQSTHLGYEHEIEEIKKMSDKSKIIERNSLNCVNDKQNLGYLVNMIVFSICMYTIYMLYKRAKIDSDKITIIILSLHGLFDNIYEITYFIPELVSKLGILKNNEDCLEDLLKNIEDEDDDVKKNMMIEEIQSKDFKIKFSNVSFKYGNHFLLNKFSMEIPNNKIIGLFGPSGSGKSTFTRLIFGIQKPLEGEIKIGGYSITNIKESSSAVRQFISYMNQNTNNLLNKTVFENITYGIEDDENVVRNKVKEILEKFNLYKIFSNLDEGSNKFSFLDKPVGKLGENLSGGQKALIHLIRLGLNKRSKIIILDEATAALDDNTRDNIIEYIKYLNYEGKNIFIITHDTYFKKSCDYLIEFSSNENPKLINNQNI